MASKVKYKINMVEVFNRAYESKSVQVRNKLRPSLSDAFIRRAYGLAVIEEIEHRTVESNIDKHGKTLGRYSEEYAASLFGRIYGKKEGARVNLFASGQMMASMEPVPGSRQNITIVFSDKFNNDKAHGHINGYIKRKSSLKRDFFGLPEIDEEKILKKILRNIDLVVQTQEILSILPTAQSRAVDRTEGVTALAADIGIDYEE